MSNMSYCRFENTLSDMNDCLDAAMEMRLVDGKFVDQDGQALNEYEHRSVESMLEVAEELLDALKNVMDSEI